MRRAGAVALIVLIALVSPVLTDLAVLGIFASAPADWDLTASAYRFAIPAGLLVVIAATAVLWFVFKPNPLIRPAIFCATYAVAEVGLLSSTNNPAADIVAYVVSICVSSALVFGAFWWLPSVART